HPAPPHTHTLSLHDALPISNLTLGARKSPAPCLPVAIALAGRSAETTTERRGNGAHTVVSTLHRCLGEMPAENQPAQGCISQPRSEEHTSELQSRFDLVCRL